MNKDCQVKMLFVINFSQINSKWLEKIFEEFPGAHLALEKNFCCKSDLPHYSLIVLNDQLGYDFFCRYQNILSSKLRTICLLLEPPFFILPFCKSIQIDSEFREFVELAQNDYKNCYTHLQTSDNIQVADLKKILFKTNNMFTQMNLENFKALLCIIFSKHSKTKNIKEIKNELLTWSTHASFGNFHQRQMSSIISNFLKESSQVDYLNDVSFIWSSHTLPLTAVKTLVRTEVLFNILSQ